MKRTAEERRRVVKAAEVPLLDFAAERLRLAIMIKGKIENDEPLIVKSVIQADEILGKILERKPVEYENIILEGNLDLRCVDFRYKDRDGRFIVHSSIKIRSSEIPGIICFENIHFKNSIEFASTYFGDKRYPLRTCDIKFNNSIFKGDVNFEKAHFYGHTEFYRSKFYKSSNFNNVHVDTHIDFSHCVFYSYSHFHEVDFGKMDRLNRSNLNELCASFNDAIFKANVHFDDSKFYNAATFSRTRFQKVFFIKAEFYSNVFFEETQFDVYADFRYAQFDKKIGVYLLKSQFNRLDIRWHQIKNNVEYAFSPMGWDKRNDGATYIQLINNFKTMGYFEDEDDCFYQYRSRRRQADKKLYKNNLVKCASKMWGKIANFKLKTNIFTDSEDETHQLQIPHMEYISTRNYKLLHLITDSISWLSCGYGVRPNFTIACILGTIFIFGLLFWDINKITFTNLFTTLLKIDVLIIGFVLGYISKFSNLELGQKDLFTHIYSSLLQNCNYFLDNLYLSTMVFVGQTPSDFEPVGYLKFAAIIEGILGYLFLALFIVVLARKLIR